MRAITQIGLLILMAGVAFAQPRGGGFRAFGFGSGVVRQPHGNIVFPGTPIVPPSPLAVGPQASFAQRLHGTVSGFPAFTGAPFFPRRGGFAHPGSFITPQPFIFAPVPYPIGYPVPYSEPSSQAVVVVAPQQPAPPVVINQTFNAIPARPPDSLGAVSYYDSPTRPALTAQDDEVRTYLIAFKDHSIYSALAYWVEGDTLHYVTPHGRRNQASLNLIDRELTDRLNRNREPAAVQLSTTGKNRK